MKDAAHFRALAEGIERRNKTDKSEQGEHWSSKRRWLPLPNAVLGDSKYRSALTLHTTRFETANFITSMPRRAIAVGSLTTVQFGSGDRFFPHRYCGALRVEIPLKSDRQLRKTIHELRGLERKCFAARSRFAFYGYLAAVLELYVQLRRRNRAKPLAKRIAKLFGLRKQNGTHPIRVIIDATSTADIKTRSRWTRALEYAWRERKTWKDLDAFLRENGGPAGCADQFAAINPRGRYPGCVIFRYAGTGQPYLIVHKGVWVARKSVRSGRADSATIRFCSQASAAALPGSVSNFIQTPSDLAPIPVPQGGKSGIADMLFVVPPRSAHDWHHICRPTSKDDLWRILFRDDVSWDQATDCDLDWYEQREAEIFTAGRDDRVLSSLSGDSSVRQSWYILFSANHMGLTISIVPTVHGGLWSCDRLPALPRNLVASRKHPENRGTPKFHRSQR